MQVHILLAKAMMFKKVVYPTDNSIRTFPTVSSLISQEVDLARNCFTVYSKHCALSRCQEVDGTWLEWIWRVVDLLCIIKRVMHFDIPWVAQYTRRWWWWCELAICEKVSVNTLLAFLTCTLVVRPLLLNNAKVFQCTGDWGWLFGLRRVGSADYSSTVLLTLPTKVRSWFHHQYRWHQCSPQIAEGCVCNWMCGFSFSCITIHSPDCSFGHTWW